MNRNPKPRAPTPELRCLEIGPGTSPADPSWDTMDAVDRPGLTIRCEWGAQPIPVGDETYDLVYASHVLEHVPWFQTPAALGEVYRILKPGGAIEIHVPDFRKIVEAYLAGRCGDAWRKHNPAGDPFVWAAGRLFSYGGPGNWHRACFDLVHLVRHLEQAGFTRCKRIGPPRGREKHGPIDLGVRARKL